MVIDRNNKDPIPGIAAKKLDAMTPKAIKVRAFGAVTPASPARIASKS
jgi:hypothetical protein